MTAAHPLPEAVRELRYPACIRSRCNHVLEAAVRGECAHFEVDLSRLEDAARLTADVTRARYPDLRVPPHSRVAHFDAGGVPRLLHLHEALAGLDTMERARRLTELVIVSVLVDAGAGAQWRYRDTDGSELSRSEGLAVASLRWAESGGLSSDGTAHRIDVEQLSMLTATDLANAFQVRDDNPLVGVEGRVGLLRALAGAVRGRPALFVDGRLGGLVDALAARADGSRLPASAILAVLLEGLGDIWPGRLRIEGAPLGDVWPHPHAGGEGPSAGLVPFHKLSQWLSFSMLHPLEVAGLEPTELDSLTGLAEYRNGGLFVDTGVLRLRDPARAMQPQSATGELVVEWRALTVALLERLLEPVRAALGLDAARFPLPALLEGGSWAAGRQLARELRPDAGPPIAIESDGTVF